MLSHERRHARINQRLQVHIINSRKGQVEDVKGCWADAGEVAVEEDEVEDSLTGDEKLARTYIFGSDDDEKRPVCFRFIGTYLSRHL